jgi:hypothetical protein
MGGSSSNKDDLLLVKWFDGDSSGGELPKRDMLAGNWVRRAA